MDSLNLTPQGERVHIALFGRRNVGKSSLINALTGQDVSIVSAVKGTTTDPVYKAMELLPLGPVVFLDTAGLDDVSELAAKRLEKTQKMFARSDAVVLIVEAGVWGEYEEGVLNRAQERKSPLIIVVNKIDLRYPDGKFTELIKQKSARVIFASSVDKAKRDTLVNDLKKNLFETAPDEFFNPLPLIGDLLPASGLAVLIVPIDLQAPKGRLILPQVQAMRDALDNDAAVMVVKEREYAYLLQKLSSPPDLVVCDSQVVLKMVADTPPDVPCTTFSILFARYRGDLIEMARGLRVIETIKSGDKILIAEACSHHAIEDDIGRVKIPRWLKQYAGVDVKIDVSSGRDYPDNLKEYKLIIHCGGCMLTKRELFFRIQKAKVAGVSITNYGLAIAYLQGVIKRVLSPFPAALETLS